jgi:hypothetical protein
MQEAGRWAGPRRQRRTLLATLGALAMTILLALGVTPEAGAQAPDAVKTTAAAPAAAAWATGSSDAPEARLGIGAPAIEALTVAGSLLVGVGVLAYTVSRRRHPR